MTDQHSTESPATRTDDATVAAQIRAAREEYADEEARSNRSRVVIIGTAVPATP